MKLALVFNPFKYKVHEENVRIGQKYFGLFPPLSLAWVAAIAEQAGHEVIIIDARTLQLSQQETLRLLQIFKPDIMGFMMTTYMFPDTLEWIKFLKKQINVPVMVGGYNLRVYPEESISHLEIDFGIIEHAYYTVPALLKEIQNKTNNFANVPGLVYKKDGKIIKTDHPQAIDFDLFPKPARHLLPNELYAEFPTERRNFSVMVTSLGCPFKCNFCEAGKSPFNPRSAENVVQEIEECYDKYGIKEIDIFDYEFTGNRKRVLDICALLKQKNIDIIWACRSRIDTVDPELLAIMYKTGCRRIYFGIESGSQEILDIVNKKQTLAQVVETISWCKKIGIKTLGFFLIGAPNDTEETIKETVKFAKSLDLDYVQFSKCLAKPLTSLWQELVAKTKKDYWKDWILGKEVDRQLERPWTSLTNEQIDKLAKQAYLSYYVRPKFLIKALLELKSFKEFKRKLFALFEMIFTQEDRSKDDKKFYAFNENSRNDIAKARKKLEDSLTS
ncbi:MAG: B12-binding domain-containing radical SAM protein [Candidatus Omnitrophica bacterium]|nr:B12-binding domain-containing radical SAM protein [Candidatus Omnitrophota bacterium]